MLCEIQSLIFTSKTGYSFRLTELQLMPSDCDTLKQIYALNPVSVLNRFNFHGSAAEILIKAVRNRNNGASF